MHLLMNENIQSYNMIMKLTLLFHDVDGDVYEILKVKISLILWSHRSNVQRKVLWMYKRANYTVASLHVVS